MLSAENIAIQNYLAAKWNITLDENDFYSEIGDYINDVQGILRITNDDEFTNTEFSGGLAISDISAINGNNNAFFVGHDNGASSLTNNYANRIWYADVTGITTGDVTLTFRVAELGLIDGVDYNLVISSDNSTVNLAASSYTIAASSGEVSFNVAVNDINGRVFTIISDITISESNVELVKNASNTINYQVIINNITGNSIASFSVASSGDNIFTTNPAPVVSFTTNAIVTTMALSSTPTTATLYFTIIPDATGTGLINISLTNSFNITTTKSVTVTVIETNSSPVITNAFDNRLFNVSVFGGSIYANTISGTINNGSAASTFQGVINDLGGHFLILNSSQERTFIDGSIGFINSWYGIVTDKAISSNDSTTYPFNLLQVTDSATQIYAQVTADTVYSLYPGFYDREWSSTQPSNEFANGTIARLMSQFVLKQNNFGFGGRKANYEFPNGFVAIANTLTASLTQSSSTTIATLSGFDLDGDNLIWSATDSNSNGTITFSSTTNTLAPTSTIGVFYQTNSNFIGNTTVTIVLSDNNASTTIDIAVEVQGIDFTLATNTINLIENTSNTIRYQLAISNITGADNIGTSSISTTGDTIFTTNPAPVVSFATISIATTQTLSSAPTTANLYFTIIPDATGTGVINISLQDTSGNTTTKSVTVTVIETNSSPVITDAFDSRLLNVRAFGGSIYANSAVGGNVSPPHTAGDNASHVADFIDVLSIASNTHFAIANSTEENTNINTGLTTNNWQGLVSDKVFTGSNSNADYPFNLLIENGFGSQTYAQVTADGVYAIYPGFYDLPTWIQAGGGEDQPGNRFSGNGRKLRLLGRFLFDEEGFGNRQASYEFPNGFVAIANTLTASLTQSSSTTIATLSGFDLDGDNLIWSAIDSNGNGTITFSSTTNTLASTSTIGIFYQINSSFFGNTTVTIILSDNNNASTTIDIAVEVQGIDFTLATNTINLIENASNTIRYQLAISNIISTDNIIGTFSVSTTGNDIFTSNPTPVVSFATTSIATTQTLSSIPATANLYFTIIPDATHTGVINISLQNQSGNTTTKSVTVTVIETNSSPVITDAFDSRIKNVSVFGGKLYANSVVANTNGISQFYPIINDLGGHFAVIDSINEQSFMINIPQYDQGWLGMYSANVSTPFNIELLTDTTTETWAEVTNLSNQTRTVYPGRFNVNFIGSDQTRSDGNYMIFNNGDYYLVGNNNNSVTRPAIFEFPSGLPVLTTASFTLTQNSAITQVATLTGFDLDGDNLTWSATDISGNSTITFSTTNTLASTSTVGVFYQANSEFYGNTTLTITASDGTNSSTAFIDIYKSYS